MLPLYEWGCCNDQALDDIIRGNLTVDNATSATLHVSPPFLVTAAGYVITVQVFSAITGLISASAEAPLTLGLATDGGGGGGKPAVEPSVVLSVNLPPPPIRRSAIALINGGGAECAAGTSPAAVLGWTLYDEPKSQAPVAHGLRIGSSTSGGLESFAECPAARLEGAGLAAGAEYRVQVNVYRF